MPVKPKVLAEDIKLALDQADQPTSDENIGMATAILAELTENALVTIAPPGLTGDAPSSGGPLLKGKAVGGKLLGVAGITLAKKMQSEMGFPAITAELTKMATGIANHFLSKGEAVFDEAAIVGPCTNTPVNPGVLTGAGAKGKIVGLDPDSLASAMAPQGPATDEIKAVASAIVKHIHDFAEVSFASPFVFAVCTPGGGPISGGTANGGKVS